VLLGKMVAATIDWHDPGEGGRCGSRIDDDPKHSGPVKNAGVGDLILTKKSLFSKIRFYFYP
jgi:hypothetical protein